MKEPPLAAPSAKLRTRSKFDLLLKTALEEQKLDRSPNVVDSNKESETVELVKRKSKKSRSKVKEGIVNPNFQNGSKIELRPVPRPRSSSRNPQNGDDNLNKVHDVTISPSKTHSLVAKNYDTENLTNQVGGFASSSSSEVNKVPELIELKTLAVRANKSATADGTEQDLALPKAPTVGDDAGLEMTAKAQKEVRVSHNKKKNRRETIPTQNESVLSDSNTKSPSHSVENIDTCPQIASAESRVVSEQPVENGSGRILSVRIHRVDRLKVNLTVKHPLVRIHLVDGSTGTCFSRLKKTANEEQTSNKDLVQPAMTQPFDMKTRRSLVPVWEEQVNFPVDFQQLMEHKSDVIVFFEILDFLSMSRAQDQYSKLGTDSGWYRIAWAFLRLVGSDGSLNTDRKAQLQLFRFPKRQLRPEPRILDLFQLWSLENRQPYPSTLYVTVFSVVAISPVIAAASASRASPERHHLQDDANQSMTMGAEETSGPPDQKVSAAGSISNYLQHERWTRLPGQSCKIPNSPHLRFPATSERGSFAVNFSHDGRLCACTCHKDSTAEILLHEIPSGRLLIRLGGHGGLIYGLQFSSGDQHLVSCSSDGSARVWRMKGKLSACVHVLPHPSYVYAAVFHPDDSTVVTACYDTVVRVWKVGENGLSKYGQLLQELDGHRSRVNALCFDQEGEQLFTGDGSGTICQWSCGGGGDWTLQRKTVLLDMQDVSITSLFMHPTLNRLLVQSLDSSIRAVDIRGWQVVHKYQSLLNFSEHIRGCVTPCGNFLFSGSEDHCVYVWNALTGARVTVFDELPFGRTVHCVVYHPHDHLVAFCSYGGGSQTLIYKYDHQVAARGVNLVQPADKKSPNLSTTLSPRLASTPLKEFSGAAPPPGLTFHLSDTAGSATCLEKIMRKLDSVLETTVLRTAQGKFESGSSPGNTFDYRGEPSCHSDEGTSAVSGDDCAAQWPFKSTGKVGSTHKNSQEQSKNVSALLTRSGELAFLSDSDESENKLSVTVSRRERRRQRTKHNFSDENSS